MIDGTRGRRFRRTGSHDWGHGHRNFLHHEFLGHRSVLTTYRMAATYHYGRKTETTPRVPEPGEFSLCWKIRSRAPPPVVPGCTPRAGDANLLRHANFDQ